MPLTDNPDLGELATTLHAGFAPAGWGTVAHTVETGSGQEIHGTMGGTRRDEWGERRGS